MIRVAVVEDDAEVQGVLQEYIRRYTRQYGTEFEVSVFADGMDILDNYRAVYDIIFLDVEMKHLDGMTTAERIRQMDADVILIFITNMAQYAIRGYSVGALDYVLKPVPYFAFSEQLKKAEKNLARQPLSHGPGGERPAAAGQLPAVLSGKRRPPGALLHRGRRFFGTGHPQGSGGKVGGPPLCPLQQRLSGKSGAGAGGAAEHGAGGTL